MPYFGAFVGLGLAMSFFGPALPTLRAQTGSTIDEMGWIFSAQSIGGLVGSILAGRWYRTLGGRHLIALALAGFAAAIALVALPTELAVIVGLGAIIGLGAGATDVGANTVLPSVVEPAVLVSSMNALHMCFAVGAVAAPLIIGASLQITDSLWPACALIAVGSAGLAGALWFGDRRGAAARAAADHQEQGSPPDRWRLALVGLFFVLYVGLEIGFAGWIATYSDELGLGSGWATGLTAAFWAGFLAGRIAMVGGGDAIDTARVLRWSIGGATTLAVVVVLVGARPIPLLVASVLFGAAIAPQFPTMLAHLHRVVPLTGPVTAWCIGGSAVGGLIFPPAIGELLDSLGTSALPWTVTAASAASGAVVFAINRWALVLVPPVTDAATIPA